MMSSHSDAESIARNFKEFTYIVSHDLGTPLRAMVEFSRLLKADEVESLSEESRLYLSMIVENGERAQAMLSGLLEYSRINTVLMPFSPTDCNQLLRQCQAELGEKVSGREAALTMDPLPVLWSDSDQMKRLFLALLENALIFHPPGARPDISVSAKLQSGEWVFAVRDNGIGIDPKFYERIFQPFKRLHPEGAYPGIGMGLALAKRIADRHDGRIWVDSIPGQGSSFMVAFPDRKAA